MPTLPTYDKCIHLGCKNKKAKLSGYCVEHGGKDTYNANTTEERKQSNSMYQTAFWRSTRATQLSRQPLCQSCLARGIVTPALHVDHLFPWRKIGSKAFKHNVFQSLCHECHSHKTKLEAQGICRYYELSNIIDYSVEQYAQVVDFI